MLQIRQGVFETNSSSTHSITMCMKSEYDAWKNGDLYLNEGWWGSNCTIDAKDKKFVAKDEAIILMGAYDYCEYNEEELRNLSDEELEEEIRDSELYSFEDYWHMYCGYLEGFEDTFTTENGDEVIAFGYYGYN